MVPDRDHVAPPSWWRGRRRGLGIGHSRQRGAPRPLHCRRASSPSSSSASSSRERCSRSRCSSGPFVAGFIGLDARRRLVAFRCSPRIEVVELLGEPGPRAGAAALHGAGRHVEDLGRLVDAEALRCRRARLPRPAPSAASAARRCTASDVSRSPIVSGRVAAGSSGQRLGRPHRFAAGQVEAGVDHDAMQPGRHR